MNCRVFTENLERFIEEDMPEELKKEMKAHMISCESCRRLYEDELFIEKAFKEALSIDDVIFESQKDKIMSKIDKIKYVKSYHKNYKVYKSLLKIGGPIAAAIAFIVLINPLSRFQIITNKSAEKTAQENKVETYDNIYPSQDKKETNKAKDIAIIDKSNEKFVADNTTKGLSENRETESIPEENISNKQAITQDANVSNGINNNIGKDTVKEIDKDTNKELNMEIAQEPLLENDDETRQENNGFAVEEIEEEQKKIWPSFAGGGIPLRIPVNFNRKPVEVSMQYKLLDLWNVSPDKDFGFYLPSEESYPEGRLYIRDIYNKENWYLELSFAHRKAQPKYIKWDNGDNLFVIFKESKNELSYGEELYMVNVRTGDALLVYKVVSDNKSILEVSRENNDIRLKIDVNKYDNHNKVYEEYMIYDVPKRVSKDIK